MSTFGSPGGAQKVTKPTPPERGSFPLDHDGECKSIMAQYLKCIRSHRGRNDPECRNLSKSYLSCRMDHNLMAPDSFKNLGFADDDEQGTNTSTPGLSAATVTPSQQQPPAQTQDKSQKS